MVIPPEKAFAWMQRTLVIWIVGGILLGFSLSETPYGNFVGTHFFILSLVWIIIYLMGLHIVAVLLKIDYLTLKLKPIWGKSFATAPLRIKLLVFTSLMSVIFVVIKSIRGEDIGLLQPFIIVQGVMLGRYSLQNSRTSYEKEYGKEEAEKIYQAAYKASSFDRLFSSKFVLILILSTIELFVGVYLMGIFTDPASEAGFGGFVISLLLLLIGIFIQDKILMNRFFRPHKETVKI